MNAIDPKASSAVLSVRLSASERALLAAAADELRTTLSDFVRRKALEAAEMDLMERRVITISAKDWEKFEAWMDAPPRDLPGLRKLVAKTPAWKQ